MGGWESSPPFGHLCSRQIYIYNRNIYFEIFQTQRSGGDGDIPLDQLIPPLQEVDPEDALAVPEEEEGEEEGVEHIEIGLEVVQGSGYEEAQMMRNPSKSIKRRSVKNLHFLLFSI